MFKEGMLALVGQGFIETIYMTVISTVLAYIIGLPLGLVLVVTDKDGIHPIPWLNSLLGMIINFFRSIPFLILLIALMPFTKMVVGTIIGAKAAIVGLWIAAAPFIARMVESSLKEVEIGVVEAAQSMGASPFQIMTKVLLPEAKPSSWSVRQSASPQSLVIPQWQVSSVQAAWVPLPSTTAIIESSPISCMSWLFSWQSSYWYFRSLACVFPSTQTEDCKPVF